MLKKGLQVHPVSDGIRTQAGPMCRREDGRAGAVRFNSAEIPDPEIRGACANHPLSISPRFGRATALSLYIHIPWCVRKCPYCDFNSHEARTGVAGGGVRRGTGKGSGKRTAPGCGGAK